MKITCEYCGNLFDDTNANCPHCGAPNKGVVRKSGGQPVTIEELKQWYASKGLPPYETTRFFIGQDYRKPKAFGIYKDEKTGNCVVYKNKADGSRAVRYEGTDEAYAVNELYQRLKQEIIQQKRASLQNRSPAPSRSSKSSEPSGCLADILKAIGRIAGIGSAVIFGLFFVFFAIVWVEDEPNTGYYFYHNTPYYYYINESNASDCGWVLYDRANDRWGNDYLSESDVPANLEKNKQAKEYYVGSAWSSRLCGQDFKDSLFYQDHLNNFYVASGYYMVDDITYYHVSDSGDYGWYVYDVDDDWSSISTSDVPEDLKHSVPSEDFFFTPTWDSSTQITDFEDSAAYTDYWTSHSSSSSYDSSDSGSGWDWDDDDDDWDWDSGDSWDSDWGGSDWDSDW